MRKMGYLVAAACFVVALSGCQKEEGPAEKTGKEIDKAVKDAGQAMENAAESVKEGVKKESK